MFSHDDKEIDDILRETGVTYRWDELNIDLIPELHKRQFQLRTVFNYIKGQAEATEDVIRYHVLKNFRVLLKLIQLKNLNVKNYYFKVITEYNNPLISYVIHTLDEKTLLSNINLVLDNAKDPENPSPFLFSTETHKVYIIEIKFVFTIMEDFYA